MFSPEPFLFDEALISLGKNKNPLIHKSLRIYNGLRSLETEKFIASFEDKISIFDKRKQFCNMLAYCLKMLEINPLHELAAATGSLVLEKFGLFLLAESIAFNAYDLVNISGPLLERLLAAHIRNMDIVQLDRLISQHTLAFLQLKNVVKQTIGIYGSVQHVMGLESLKKTLLQNANTRDINKHLGEIDIRLEGIRSLHVKLDALPDLPFKDKLALFAEDKQFGAALASAFFWLKYHSNPTDLDILYQGCFLIPGETSITYRLGYAIVNFLRLSPQNDAFITRELNFDVFKRFNYLEMGYRLTSKYAWLACNDPHLPMDRRLKFYYDYLVFDTFLGVTRREPLISFELATTFGLLQPYNLDILQLGSVAILADKVSNQKKCSLLIKQLPVKNQEETLRVWQQVQSVTASYHIGFFEKFFNWFMAFILKKAKLKPKKMIAILLSGQIRKPEVSHQVLDNLFTQLGSLKSVRLASLWDKQGSSTRSDNLQRFMPVNMIHSLPEYMRKPKFLANYLPTFFEKITAKQDSLVSKSEIIKLFKLNKLNTEDESQFDASISNYPKLYVRGATNQAKMYFQIAKAFDMARSKARDYFYTVIRIRPDLNLSLSILREMCIVAEQKKDTIFITHVFPMGVGDQFAVGSPLVMELYCSLWSNAKSSGQFQYLSCFPEGTKGAGEILLQYHLMAFGLSMCLIPSTYKLINPNQFGAVDNRRELFSDFEKLDLKFKNQFWGFYQQYARHVQDLRKDS